MAGPNPSTTTHGGVAKISAATAAPLLVASLPRLVVRIWRVSAQGKSFAGIAAATRK